MFRVFSHRLSLAFLLLFVVSLLGCTAAPTRETLPSAAERLVAKDFAQIVSQVERYAPASTTFRVARPIGPVDPFDIALREELLIAGYKIDFLNFRVEVTDPVVSHDIELSTSDDGEVRTYTVSVSNVDFRRAYSIGSDGRVKPLTSMQAKGLDAAGLRQDDAIFGEEFDELTNSSQSENALADNTTRQSIPDLTGDEPIVIPPTVSLEGSADNENILQGMSIVDESLLIFDGESLLLGERNKRRVVDVVKNFNKDSDVFSMLGCISSEDSERADDASAIVRGRTERVRSELRYAGIPDEKIKTESCVGDGTTDAPNLPPDSVLLLLNRNEI